MEILDRIKNLCSKRNISVGNLEKELELSNGSIYKWGNSVPRADTLLKVANYLGVSVEYLLETSKPSGGGKQMSNLISIENKDGNLVVSSREVAKNFEKEHKHVLEARDNLKEGLTENSTDLFYETNYIYEQNKQEYREILMNKDGFTLLAMGFTGQKALEWKLKYIEAFNKMEDALKEVYHISQTAIVNNIMETLEDKLFTSIDQRLSVYEENYRPTYANEIDLNNYIKSSLGEDRECGEVELVKQRVLLILDAETWQDVPYKRLIDNMRLIDESIRAVKSFRTKSQLSLFEE